MDKFRRFKCCMALLAVVMSLAGVSAQAREDEPTTTKSERELVEILRSAPPAEQAMACKRLAIYGSKDAVPDLARLLADAELASWARIALEAIPDSAADEALRSALPKLTGLLLVGTINSIGVRHDSHAVDPLAGLLKNSDVDIASAAAVALGRIGNDAATKTLRQALAAAGPAQGAVAEGCILCAERLVRDGKTKEAAEIYDSVRRANVPKPRILEATRGAILARKGEGIPLLIEQVRSPDKALFQIGLGAARELAGHDVSAALAAEVARTSPDRAALVLYALADRRDPAVLPAVLNAAKSGDKQVRIAALDVVGRLGDSSTLSPLLEIAIESDAELAQSAQGAMAALSDKKVDADVTARLANAQGKTLAVLIELVGQRRIGATGNLIKALDHPDEAVRSAALTSLGATISPQELSTLISQAINPKNAADTKVAQRALRAACLRMPDRESCAAEVAAALPRASTATQANLLETLGAMGGPKALETIGVAMKNNDPQLQDTGSRVLGEWMTVDAGPVLLDLAKSAPDDKYRVRALRGYIRIARQFAMPDPQRAEMCQNALAAANRTDEQKLVLAVLERYPNKDTLAVAAKATQVPALRDDAARATLVIVQKLGGEGAKMRELLAKTGLDPMKVDIIKAEYGSGTSQKDVTASLKKCVDSLPLIVLPSPKYNESFGDPAPGTAKILKVQYQINGKAGDVSFPENALIMLPMPK